MGAARGWIRSLIDARGRSRRPGREAGACVGPDEEPLSLERHRETALSVVRRAILRAEEHYLVDPTATLGTWFAQVQETIAAASRVTLRRIEEGRSPAEEDMVGEQVGLFADVCAEAIRAAARACGTAPSSRVREEFLQLVARRAPRDGVSPRTACECLACCAAALEPIANGLREGDLPMGEPSDCEAIAECFTDLACHAFGAVCALC